MSAQSKIEWTDATWNPVTGCTKVSAGCSRCYAERWAERWRGIPGHPFEMGFDLTMRPGRLEDPYHWQKPRRVFVCSMSDLFHASIPFEFIDRVFKTIRANPRHTFQVLTKRAERLDEYARARGEFPSNVWLGVSAETQDWADRRIVALLSPEVKCRMKWVSCEPLLGAIDLEHLTAGNGANVNALTGDVSRRGEIYAGAPALNWVVFGGESGPGARNMDPQWARSIRDQCARAGVPFFFKQWGGKIKSKRGRELDGRTYDEMPGAV